jgi:hypothetical protein
MIWGVKPTKEGVRMEDFNLFSTKDRQDISYLTCVGGTTLITASIGRIGMLPGLLAGAATGLMIGLIMCKRLSPAIERKIFSSSERLTDSELISVLRLIRDQTGVQTKSEAMYLLSQARLAAVANGGSIRESSSACLSPRVAAVQLLAQRA